MLRLLLLLALLSLAAPGIAQAGGGDYVFEGGTPAQQHEVRKALEASAFPWGVVPVRVTIHIGRFGVSRSTPGEIWLDGDLLRSREFSWAVVQDEYAHQVDFFLFDDETRARLQWALGASDWCYDVRGLPHSAYGCERFASTLVWSYWPSQRNTYRPRSAADESAALAPADFRALMGRILGI